MASAMKRIQRMRQQGLEMLGRGDKSDSLTDNLHLIERKVELIREGCQITTKRLSANIMGSGATVDKHQKKLPQHALGSAMVEFGAQLEGKSVFGCTLEMVGQVEKDIACQQAQHEIILSSEIIGPMNQMLEEDMKTVDKAKKKLTSARLDMDAAKNRLRSLEHQSEKSSREYPLGRIDALKAEVDEKIRKFEDCQDAYATSMFSFLSKEQEYTSRIVKLVEMEITMHKLALVSLEATLPMLQKRMSESLMRPVFGMSLQEHLRVVKQDTAVVIVDCCNALRESWLDMEGLFRIAASAAKVKFLKSTFNAGERGDLAGHDPHAIAGCLKMYLRELPEPLLTFDLYSEWIKAAGIGDYNDRLTALWDCKEKLPEANKTNFRHLLAFLYDFAQYHEVTKMNVSNIAIVIGPNLLWPKDEGGDALLHGMVTDTAITRRLTETFIDKCQWFFPDIADPPPPNLPNKNSSLPLIAQQELERLEQQQQFSSPPPDYTPSSPLPDNPSPLPAAPPTPPASHTTEAPSTPPHSSSPKPVHVPIFVAPPTVSVAKPVPAPIAPGEHIAPMTGQVTPVTPTLPKANSSPPMPPKPYSEHSTPGAGSPMPLPRPSTAPKPSTIKGNPPSPAPKPRSHNHPVPVPRNRTISDTSFDVEETEKRNSLELRTKTASLERGSTVPSFSTKHPDSFSGSDEDLRPTPPARTKRPPQLPSPKATAPPRGVPSSTTPTKGGGRGPSRRAPPPPKKIDKQVLPRTVEEEFSAL